MRFAKKHLLILVIAVAILGTGIGVFIRANSQSAPAASRDQEWQNFKSYTASMQLPGKAPLHNSTGTIGCFPYESYYDPSIKDCTFTAAYYYQPAGNYRDNGREIYAFLQQQGYYFDDKDKQRGFEEKLHNTALADNLSNSEPIVVHLYHKNKTWVRLYLGDKARTLGPTSRDVQGALANVKDDQLIAVLSFNRNL